MSNNNQNTIKVDIKLGFIGKTYIDKMVLGGALFAFVIPALLLLEYILLEIDSPLYILCIIICFISGLYLFITWKAKKKNANIIRGITHELECPMCKHKENYALLTVNFTCPNCNGHNKLPINRSNISKFKLPITESSLLECKHCGERIEISSIKNYFKCTSCKKTVK